jgi:Arc/MetJ family transcription regulator
VRRTATVVYPLEADRIYGGNVAKTLIDIDEELLARAQQLLHTKTKKDTVTQALREVVTAHERAAAIAAEVERAKSGAYDFLISEQNDAWR